MLPKKQFPVPGLLREYDASGASLPASIIVKLKESAAFADPGKADYLPTTAQRILDILAPCLRVESLSLLLYDGPSQSLSLFAMTGVGEIDLGQEHHAPGQHLTGATFASGRTFSSNDIASEPLVDRSQVAYWANLLPSRQLSQGIYVPFHSTLECRGVFRAFNRLNEAGSLVETGFSHSDVAVFEQIAKVVGYVFGSAWERNAFHALTHAFSTIPGREEIREMCGAVARTATALANCVAAALYVVDAADEAFLRLAGSWGFSRPHPALSRFPVATSVAGRVARDGRSELIFDLESAPGVANREVGVAENFLSCAAVPVRGTTVRGCLAVFARDKRRFQRTTVDLLGSLGLYAGSLIQAKTAYLQTESQKKILQQVGHSLRSPLAGITQATSDLLFEINKGDDAEAIRELIMKIKSYKDLAERRTETLLFAKSDILDVMGIDKKPVDLSQLIADCVERQRLPASIRGVALAIKESARKLPLVRCDKGKIDIAFDNLLENAIKYSWSNQSVEIAGWYSEKQVRISISDKGLGIPARYHEAIFEAFGRSDVLDSTRYIRGTGLGLQLVKSVVDAHQGKVELKSTPFLDDPLRREKMEGFETVFTVTLPR